MNDNKEFNFSKQRFIYRKLSSVVLSIVYIYYILKFNGKISTVGYVYVVAFLIVIIYYPNYKLLESVKKEKDIVKNSLPNFLTKINLLMGSGMSSINSIKIASTKKNSKFEKAICKVIREVEYGSSISESFYELSQQCQDVYITQFIRVIIQDRKYGSKTTIDRLENICDEIWKNKKNDILKKGEEASTKLLFPMMIALISVLIAVTVPAIYQLFQI